MVYYHYPKMRVSAKIVIITFFLMIKMAMPLSKNACIRKIFHYILERFTILVYNMTEQKCVYPQNISVGDIYDNKRSVFKKDYFKTKQWIS